MVVIRVFPDKVTTTGVGLQSLYLARNISEELMDVKLKLSLERSKSVFRLKAPVIIISSLLFITIELAVSSKTPPADLAQR